MYFLGFPVSKLLELSNGRVCEKTDFGYDITLKPEEVPAEEGYEAWTREVPVEAASRADATERVPPHSDATERVPPDSDATERVPPGGALGGARSVATVADRCNDLNENERRYKMKLIKTIITMVAAMAATVGYAGDSAPFRLDTMEGTRVARETETIAYSTEWDNGEKVVIAVDGVTLKEASAPASGDVAWDAKNASAGNHTLTHTTYKNGVADKVESVTFKVNGGGSGGGSAGGYGGGGSGGSGGGGNVAGNWIAGRFNTGFAKVQTVLGALYGSDGVPVGTVQVKAGKINAKKGMVKISGNATLLIDGKAKKVSAKAVNVALDATGRVYPVTLAFKAPVGEISFEMAADGTFTLKSGNYSMAEKNVGGDWSKSGAKVYVDGGRGATALPAGTTEELLPDGEPVIPKGGKWSFDKAASVKYAKDKATGAFNLVIDDTKGTNRSAMKLTYTPKTGIFKGSFKIYAIQDGKLKKFTVKVIGVVVDGKGSGSATGPNGLRFDVRVE